MDIPSTLFLLNEYQQKNFSCYDIVIYFCLFESIYKNYPWGYEFYAKLTGERPFTRLQKLKRIKKFLAAKKKSLKLTDPIIVHVDYSLLRNEDSLKVATALYLGIPAVPSEVKKIKKEGGPYYDIAWLEETYEPAEVAQILLQKARLLDTIKAP